jgi:hypothetical protein
VAAVDSQQGVGEASAAVWSAAMTMLLATGDGGEVAIVMDLHGRGTQGEDRCGKKLGGSNFGGAMKTLMGIYEMVWRQLIWFHDCQCHQV